MRWCRGHQGPAATRVIVEHPWSPWSSRRRSTQVAGIHRVVTRRPRAPGDRRPRSSRGERHPQGARTTLLAHPHSAPNPTRQTQTATGFEHSSDPPVNHDPARCCEARRPGTCGRWDHHRRPSMCEGGVVGRSAVRDWVVAGRPRRDCVSRRTLHVMEQHLYEAEHEEFRALCRAFLAREAVPYHDGGRRPASSTGRSGARRARPGCSAWTSTRSTAAAGSATSGSTRSWSRRSSPPAASGLGFGLHNDVVAPYLTELTTEEQRKRWLPGFCSGDLVTAIAMSEPGAGSPTWPGSAPPPSATATSRSSTDRRRSSPTASCADLVIVVAKTDPAAGRARHQPDRGRARHAGLHPRPPAGEGRTQGQRHRRAVLRRLPGARRQPASARRTPASTT